LISRPDTSGPGQAILAPPVSVPALLAHCQPRADPRVCCTLMHAQPRFRPVLRCPGAADHQDPVMTSYLPRSNPGPRAGARAWRGSLPAVPVPLEPADAPRGGSLATAASGLGAAVRATSAARLAPVQKFSHRIMVRRLCPAADIPEPAGLDNHRNPVMASHRPGGESGHTVVDTQRGDHDDNRHRSARAPRVPLGGG
jgi:hypothetical protein